GDLLELRRAVIAEYTPREIRRNAAEESLPSDLLRKGQIFDHHPAVRLQDAKALAQIADNLFQVEMHKDAEPEEQIHRGRRDAWHPAVGGMHHCDIPSGAILVAKDLVADA